MDETWHSMLAAGVAARDAAVLRRVPKADLHCHGLLSAPLAAYARLAEGPLPPPPAAFGDFDTFGTYIVTHLLPILARGPHVAEAVIRATFERFVEDGVVYAEPSFDLLLPGFIGLTFEEFADLLAAEAARVAEHVVVAPEIGIDRSLPPDALMPLLREAIATGAFRSVDLYADERIGDVSTFVPLYRLAEEHGLKLKAHAGELCGPDHVRHALDTLRLHAVQHGVRAAESPALMEQLARRGTVLHLCPSSNCSLGICPALEDHPARRLFDSGVRITVNSDDYTLFGVGVSEELLNLATMGFSPDEIARVVATGLAEQAR